MDSSLDPEVLIFRRRANLLKDIGTAASASQAAAQRSAFGEISRTASNVRIIDDSVTPPLQSHRGRNIDIVV